QGRNASPLQERSDAVDLVVLLTCETAKLDQTVRRGLLDDPRCAERGAYARHAGQYGAAIKCRLQISRAIDAVLERQEDCPGDNHWLDECRCSGDIVGLHAKQHKIRWRESCRVGTRRHWEGKIAVHTAHGQAMLLQSAQVCPTGDKRHVCP